MPPTSTPNLVDTMLAEAKYKRRITTASGHALWMVCDRPFADAATDMLRDAIRTLSATPSVLSRVARQPIPTP